MGGVNIDPYHSMKQSHDPFGIAICSFGQEAFGYTVRLAPAFSLLRPNPHGVLDPHALDETLYTHVNAPFIYVQPGKCVLGHSIEYIKVPGDVLGFVQGKSTYSRLGLVVNATPLEPGWEGQITLTLANTNNLPIKVYAGEGIAQCVFFQGTQPKATYRGAYQRSKGVKLTTMEERL
jgi:dCTP deaminase